MKVIKLILVVAFVCIISSSTSLLLSSSSWLKSYRIIKTSSTSLKSSSLMNILPPERFFGDDSNNMTGDQSLDLLISNDSPLIITIEELQVKWIDLCIEKSRPQDIDMFSLKHILPFIIRDDNRVQLVNKTDEAISESSSTIYITDNELQRLWHEKSLEPFGKAIDSFKIEDALLLLEDDEDTIIIGNNDNDENYDNDDNDDNTSLIMKSSLQLNKDIIKSNDIERISDLYITEEELKRIWADRSTVWGMPSNEFNIKDALLYLDDEEDGIDVDGNKIKYVNSFYSELKDRENFLKNFNDEKYDNIRDEVQQIYDYIEDTSYYRPPWKKSSNFLTPDIDTQGFMGDIMSTTNTYQWSRIPANYMETEEDEANSILSETDTMAMPGEPETDYTIKIPIWDKLDLPYRPKDEESVEFFSLPPTDEVNERSGPVDWSDPSVFNNLPIDNDSKDALDINSFFEDLSDNKENSSNVSTEEPEEWGLDTRRGYDKESICKNWITPTEWLENPEFANHVGFDTWSKYDDDDFLGADDKVWEEDIATAQCIKHVLDITDYYLNDQQKLTEEIDDHKYWDRVLNAKLTGDIDPEALKEPISPHLEPFKHRGLKYTDEIIEMKGKKVLSAYLDPPAVMWANDTFTHNENAVTMNKVGIIREQYDWAYTLSTDQYKIDEKMVTKLEPLLKFCNHLAKLKSTKDNILIFEYFGMIRNIIGIRSMMIKVAKECVPDIVDVRLETDKKNDKDQV